jgi:TIR- and PNP-associating SLOG family
MTSKSPLFGRRIHFSGSVSSDLAVATTDDVKQARDLIQTLSRELVSRGATFVLPVDSEKPRAGDNLPICFDWLIWQTLHSSLARRPTGAPNPLVVAVEHHKTEEQIPAAFHGLWDELRGSDLIQVENVSHWNMNSKRLEAQARWGEILVPIGGAEGVLFLANLYHDAGKPVIPLNSKVTGPEVGARRLFSLGLSSLKAPRLFQPMSQSAHSWMNRINFTSRTSTTDQAETIIELLEALERPPAFVVRLLNPTHEDYADVQAFFDIVVQPVMEGELGYRMVVVDGRQKYEQARIDQEIFVKLHRSTVVLADLTGMRPNCFLELGYAFGRGLPTMVMAKEGSPLPFDIQTFAGLPWKTVGSADDRRRAFREHWAAIQTRPPLVPAEPLIS